MKKIASITITHYSSPHLFWFKYKDANDNNGKFLSKIENDIQRYITETIGHRRSFPHSPQIGELVLVQYFSDTGRSKWIRARVDHVFKYSKLVNFVLWAIDYGFPIQSESRWIRELLSDELKLVDDALIFKGGLFNVVPATDEFSFISSNTEMVKSKTWSTKAVEYVEKCLSDADSLTFRCNAYLDDHLFGSLVVESNGGSRTYVELMLKNLQEAVDASNFAKEFKKLNHQPYWERQNENAIFKIKDNSSEQTYDPEMHHQFANWDLFDNKNNAVSVRPSENKEQNYENFKPLENEDIADVPMNLQDKFELNASVCKADSTIITKRREKENTVVPSKSNVESVAVVPMNKRFALAQQKFEEKKLKELMMSEEGKQAIKKKTRINAINKKMTSLPAGFWASTTVNLNESVSIIDTEPWSPQTKKISAKSNNNDKDRLHMDEESTVSETNCINLKKNEYHYQRALDDELCFTTTQMQHILVHGYEQIPKKTITHIYEANFSKQIHAALQAGNYNQIFRIQTIGWPIILRGGSFIVVNSAKTGKKWSYLPAICSVVIERLEDKTVVDGSGPVAIIVCISSLEVKEIAKHCKQLVRNTKILCIEAYGHYDEKKILSLLLNGAEILVTTAPCLNRLLKNQIGLFTPDRVITVVFDKIDLMYDHFNRELHDIYNALCNPKSGVETQTIITSRTWHKILEKFYKELNSVTLCIGAYLEAAVYGRTEMSVELFEHKFKKDRLISYLSNAIYRSEFTIIVCKESKEVEQLASKVLPSSIPIWHCHEKSDSCDIRHIKETIKDASSGEFSVLLCTDEVLPDLDIRNAQHIVSYSLPSNWSIFTFRFSACLEYHENLLSKSKQPKPPATSLVFLDENNNEELPRLIDFMQMRGGVNIPKKIIKFAEKMRLEIEEKRNKRFCSAILTNGICYRQPNCQERHILTKCDTSRYNVPRNGSVKFEIIATHTPVHFTVRLLEHRPPNETKWTPISSANDFLSFNIEFFNYLNNPDNQFIHSPCNLGDLCVVCVDSPTGLSYHRGKIMKIEKEKSLMIWNTIVDVLLIDTNAMTTCLSTQLLQLPTKFHAFPPQAVDVRISGIVPRDFDFYWDSKILDKVTNWLEHDEYCYLKGDIQLCLMNTLWVNSVDVMERLVSMNNEIKIISIKTNLLSNNFGVRDSKGIDLMMSLAENADMLIDRNLQPFAFESNDQLSQTIDTRSRVDIPFHHKSCGSSLDDLDQSQSQLDWSITSDDEYGTAPEETLEPLLCESNDRWSELMPDQFNKVYLTAFYHPERFYIRNNEAWSRSRLKELHERIDKYTANFCNRKPLIDAAVATNCLAELRNAFRRAKILKMFNSTDDLDNITVEVIFVDFGEFSILPLNNLIQIPHNLITMIPFQAMFCNLIGIRPLNDSRWSDSICDEIYDVLDKNSYFYARSLQPGQRDIFTYGLRCHSYSVVCVNQNTEANINNELVLNKYADYDPSTMHFIEVIVDKKLLRLLDYDSEEDEEEHNKDENNIESNEIIEIDIQFDDDDIKQLLQAANVSLNNVSANHQLPPVNMKENENQHILPQISEEKSNSPDSKELITGPEAESPTNVEKVCRLASLYMTPSVKWHQTSAVITLSIHAPDVLDYHLRVTSNLVHFCYEKDGKTFALILNLFGSVEIDYISHEIRGLNVVIRLLKSVYGLDWPRLLVTSDKHRWLTYNIDGKCEEIEKIYFDKPTNNFYNHSQSSSSVEEYDESDGIDY